MICMFERRANPRARYHILNRPSLHIPLISILSKISLHDNYI